MIVCIVIIPFIPSLTSAAQPALATPIRHAPSVLGATLPGRGTRAVSQQQHQNHEEGGAKGGERGDEGRRSRQSVE